MVALGSLEANLSLAKEPGPRSGKKNRIYISQRNHTPWKRLFFSWFFSRIPGPKAKVDLRGSAVDGEAVGCGIQLLLQAIKGLRGPKASWEMGG